MPDIITLHFNDSFAPLLQRKGHETIVRYSLVRRASIKDIIESLGIPHTEIGNIRQNDKELTFCTIPNPGSIFHITPVAKPFQITVSSILRPVPLTEYRFIIDVNVSKLGSLLRLAGFDSFTPSNQDDAFLAEYAVAQQRVLLSRDMQLLQRRNIVFGRLIRNSDPYQQLREVFDIFGLHDKINPFSRCLACNQPLCTVKKETILHLLEPLTKKYYSTFKRCISCKNIYWPGSHRYRVEEKLRKVGIFFSTEK